MISIRVELDGAIEKLLVSVMNLHVVLRGHDVVIALPILDLFQVLLDLMRFLHGLANFLNDPTLVHKIRMFLLNGFNR